MKSLKQMQAEQAQLQKDMDAQREKELNELRASIQKQVADSPFTWEEATKKVKPPRKPIQPKYQSKTNPKDTWTGRGRKPKWVEDYLNVGGKLADIEIKKSATAPKSDKVNRKPAPSKPAGK